MEEKTKTALFPMGQLVLTAGVNDRMAGDPVFQEFITDSIGNHAKGDWGQMSAEDQAENELAVKEGNLRVFSSYEKEGLPKIWIITEADRSVTTVLFPDEY